MVLESAFDEKVFGDTIANNHRRTLERTLKEFDNSFIPVETIDTTNEKDYYEDSVENNVIEKRMVVCVDISKAWVKNKNMWTTDFARQYWELI